MVDVEQLKPLAGIKFTKMNGTGNDFVVIDNRAAGAPQALMPLLAKAVCCRGRSVGADGLIILSPTDRIDERLGKVDFKWDFFNADGSSAEMCGNGGRCAARFAHDIGLAGQEMVFDTLAGPIRAMIMDGGVVKLEMVQPFGAYENLSLDIMGREVNMDGVNTGVPHAVAPVDDIESVPIKQMGREIRFHEHFAPAGTNVNFAKAAGGELMVRTYERGVEDETLACGTGAVASALAAVNRGWLEPPVKVRVRSGETLTVHFSGSGLEAREVFLEGAAAYTFEGVLHWEAFDWLTY